MILAGVHKPSKGDFTVVHDAEKTLSLFAVPYLHQAFPVVDNFYGH